MPAGFVVLHWPLTDFMLSVWEAVRVSLSREVHILELRNLRGSTHKAFSEVITRSRSESTAPN